MKTTMDAACVRYFSASFQTRNPLEDFTVSENEDLHKGAPDSHMHDPAKMRPVSEPTSTNTLEFPDEDPMPQHSTGCMFDLSLNENEPMKGPYLNSTAHDCPTQDEIDAIFDNFPTTNNTVDTMEGEKEQQDNKTMTNTPSNSGPSLEQRYPPDPLPFSMEISNPQPPPSQPTSESAQEHSRLNSPPIRVEIDNPGRQLPREQHTLYAHDPEQQHEYDGDTQNSEQALEQVPQGRSTRKRKKPKHHDDYTKDF